jgi:serine/threonine protein kinase
MFAEAVNLIATTTSPLVHRYGFGWNLTATRAYVFQGLQSLRTTPVEGIASPTVALDDNLDMVISSFGYILRNNTLVPVTALANTDGAALRNAVDFSGFTCQAPPSPFVERDPAAAPAARDSQDSRLVVGLVVSLLVCLLVVLVVSYRLHTQRGQPFDFTEMTQQLIVSMQRTTVVPPRELSPTTVKPGVQIGAGLFGSVLAGTLASGKGLRKNQSPVALKTCKAADPISERTFLFEACVLAQFLGQPHVVQLCGVVTSRQPLYLVMERCEDNLQHYLSEKFGEGKELKLTTKLRFAKEVALGMECLVKAGCVHRDLSCRNIL